MIDKSIIKEFQLAIKEDYGVEVSLEEARIILTDLTEYYSTLRKINSRK